jgi:hypothetical protein
MDPDITRIPRIRIRIKMVRRPPLHLRIVRPHHHIIERPQRRYQLRDRHHQIRFVPLTRILAPIAIIRRVVWTVAVEVVIVRRVRRVVIVIVIVVGPNYMPAPNVNVAFD